MFSYLPHKNDRKENIINTGPLLFLDVVNSTYTSYYYVPSKYQNGGLPKPLTQDVKQVKQPKYKYAVVRRIDDKIIEESILAQVDILKENLKNTSTYK